MADEDEIDVLGDFEDYLSKTNSSLYGSTSLMSQDTELLDCDYTVHPQWLLDRPSANPESWYDSTSVGLAPQSSAKQQEPPLVIQNSINDESGWTENEKSLLQRGIEIFNKNEKNLSQFIGSKTPGEVKYYLDKFYIETHPSSGSHNSVVVLTESDDSGVMTEILADIEIPTSIEEVIDTISTGKPTVSVPQKPKKKSTSFHTEARTQSRCEKRTEPKSKSVLLKKLKYSPKVHEKLKSRKPKGHYMPKKHTKFKFKTQMKIMKANMNIIPIKQKTVSYINEVQKNRETGKIELTTGRGLSVPLYAGEEIVRLKRENSGSDSDADLEIDVEDTELPRSATSDNTCEQENNSQSTVCDNKAKESVLKNMDTPTSHPGVMCSSDDNHQTNPSIPDIDLSTVSKTTLDQLMSAEEPNEEYYMDFGNITEIEKVFHPDFFDFTVAKRSPKTPERYFKIRNFILNSWKVNKPSYITKTSLRQGLRNCGDVNCIGRIHNFLEQIGAINFGCAQVTYVRPLYEVLKSSNREKSTKELKVPEQATSHVGPRQRFKKKFANDGEGGCTLTHDEKGVVIDATIVDEKPTIKKSYIKKPTIGLISCRSFSKETPQRFRVVLKLSALLPMDFHAHTSLSEVMGLVAGYWDPTGKLLTVCRYEPCRNMASSSTHCEMCPVSQARAADHITGQGLRVLGWFHSHPTFAPEPSQQDLDTQLSLQRSLGRDPPCLGVILSPFLDGYNASQFRCLVVVDGGGNFEEVRPAPYKLFVEQRAGGCDVDHLLDELRKVHDFVRTTPARDRLDFGRTFPPDAATTLLDKFIGSLKIHLSKFEDINGKTSTKILTCVHDMLKQ